jgi:hypothetical protein
MAAAPATPLPQDLTPGLPNFRSLAPRPAAAPPGSGHCTGPSAASGASKPCRFSRGRGGSIPAPTEGTSVWRIFGEAQDGIGRLQAGSRPFGPSWTPTQPDLIADFRQAAGLPNENPGRFVIEGVVRDPRYVYDVRSALPLDGNPGGLAEYLIRDAQEAVEVRGVSGVNESWTRGPGDWIPEGTN